VTFDTHNLQDKDIDRGIGRLHLRAESDAAASSSLGCMTRVPGEEPATQQTTDKSCLMTIASWYHPFPSRTGP
jgi:hypothetical protein